MIAKAQSTVSVSSPKSPPISSKINKNEASNGNEAADCSTTTPGKFLEYFMDATTLAQIQQQLAQCAQLVCYIALLTFVFLIFYRKRFSKIRLYDVPYPFLIKEKLPAL